jgi:hypothetical protein
VQAKPGSGTIVDGSKVMHAAKIFRPQVKAPHLPKDKSSNLVYVGEDNWELQIDGQVRWLWCDVLSIWKKARVFAFALESETSGFRAQLTDEHCYVDSMYVVAVWACCCCW